MIYCKFNRNPAAVAQGDSTADAIEMASNIPNGAQKVWPVSMSTASIAETLKISTGT